MNTPDDFLQFPYESNRSALDAVVFLIHHNCEALDISVKSVDCAPSEHSSELDSVSRDRQLHSMETFSCPIPLLASLFGYFTSRTMCTCGCLNIKTTD